MDEVVISTQQKHVIALMLLWQIKQYFYKNLLQFQYICHGFCKGKQALVVVPSMILRSTLITEIFFWIFCIHRQDADKDMFSNMEPFIGIAQPIKRKVSGRDRSFHTKVFYSYNLFSDSNEAGLDSSVIINGYLQNRYDQDGMLVFYFSLRTILEVP